MQVMAKPPPLLLPRRHEPLARALQIGRQAHRVDRDPGMTRQIFDQPPVHRAQRVFPGSQSEVHLADRLPLVDQR